MMTVAIAAMILFLGAPTVSAQGTTCPSHSHVESSVAMCTGADIVECVDVCVCDAGYHPSDRNAPVSASNVCVRNHRRDRDGDGELEVAELVCAFGAIRTSRGTCECPEDLGAWNPLVPILLSAVRRRALGLPARGAAQTCIDPMATAGEGGSLDAILLAALDERTRIICGSEEAATSEEVLEGCRETRPLIESIRDLRPGSVTIHYGDRDYTLQEFYD